MRDVDRLERFQREWDALSESHAPGPRPGQNLGYMIAPDGGLDAAASHVAEVGRVLREARAQGRWPSPAELEHALEPGEQGAAKPTEASAAIWPIAALLPTSPTREPLTPGADPNLYPNPNPNPNGSRATRNPRSEAPAP